MKRMRLIKFQYYEFTVGVYYVRVRRVNAKPGYYGPEGVVSYIIYI